MRRHDIYHKYFDEVVQTVPLTETMDGDQRWLLFAQSQLEAASISTSFSNVLSIPALRQSLSTHRVVMRWVAAAKRLRSRLPHVSAADLALVAALKVLNPYALTLLRRYGYACIHPLMKGDISGIFQDSPDFDPIGALPKEELDRLSETEINVWKALFGHVDSDAAMKEMRLSYPVLWRDFLAYTSEGLWIGELNRFSDEDLIRDLQSETLDRRWTGRTEDEKAVVFRLILERVKMLNPSRTQFALELLSRSAHLFPIVDPIRALGPRMELAYSMYQAGLKIPVEEFVGIVQRGVWNSRSDLFASQLVSTAAMRDRKLEIVQIADGYRDELFDLLGQRCAEKIRTFGLLRMLKDPDVSDAPVYMISTVFGGASVGVIQEMRSLLKVQFGNRETIEVLVEVLDVKVEIAVQSYAETFARWLGEYSDRLFVEQLGVPLDVFMKKRIRRQRGL